MRRRAGVLLICLILGAVSAIALAPAAFAQAEGSGEESLDQGQQEDDEGTEGQGDPEAESGVDAGQTENAPATTGPPWTYQMARIAIVLLLIIALGIGWWYYRFVLSRQRGTA